MRIIFPVVTKLLLVVLWTSSHLPTATAAGGSKSPGSQLGPMSIVQQARSLHPHITVFPKPLVAGLPALLTVRGPGRGTVKLVLTAKGWTRAFQATLPPDGKSAFGFMAPRSSVVIIADVHGKTQSATVRLTVPVVPSPSLLQSSFRLE